MRLLEDAVNALVRIAEALEELARHFADRGKDKETPE
jgi:hypothetical protein